MGTFVPATPLYTLIWSLFACICLQEESSEDSAYNEGEGVLSSDSRGSTPQNLTNKHQANTKTTIPQTSSITKNATLR